MPFAPDLSGCALDDRYELRAIIGEGAFGRVYEGFDRRLARSVAVKVIKPWWADDPEWVATFERETRLLARVSDPGIIQIFDVGHAAEGLYYVAELVDGESLASRLRRGPLPAWEACEVAAQLCRALAGAHAQRIVHRDVKPANIMLSAEGRVKVGDFGVARLAEGSTDGTAPSIVGTPRYMAPEQGRGRSTTPATDVYSAGVVLYEMLSGAPPFTATSFVELALLHLQDPPPPLSPRLPASLVQIVDRALAKDPARRFADGGEMAEALLEAAEAPPPRAGHGGPWRPGHARRSARPAALWWVPAPRRCGLMRRPGIIGTHPRRPTRPTGSAAPAGAASAAHARSSRDAARPSVLAATHRQPGAAPPGDRGSGPRHRPARGDGGGGTGHRPHDVRAGPVRAAPLTGPRRFGAAPRPPARDHPQEVRIGQGGDGHRRDPARPHRVARGTAVALTISRGPAPVQVLNVVHSSVADAERALHGLGFHTVPRNVPAPGTAPGTVVGQTPASGQRPRGSTVTLNVAEVPSWHTVTTFTGGDSGAFRIIGRHWRVVYTMGFRGTCNWILFCSGPTARVVDAARGLRRGLWPPERHRRGPELRLRRRLLRGPRSPPVATTPAGRSRSRTTTRTRSTRWVDPRLDAVTPSRREWGEPPPPLGGRP